MGTGNICAVPGINKALPPVRDVFKPLLPPEPVNKPLVPSRKELTLAVVSVTAPTVSIGATCIAPVAAGGAMNVIITGLKA